MMAAITYGSGSQGLNLATCRTVYLLEISSTFCMKWGLEFFTVLDLFLWNLILTRALTVENFYCKKISQIQAWNRHTDPDKTIVSNLSISL